MSTKNPVDVLKRRILAMTEASNRKHRLINRVLFGLSMVFEFMVRARVRLYDIGVMKTKRLPCFVISIGNLTVGGTGKTPTTVCLARELSGLGYRPVILSRGYKGSLEKKGGLVSDGFELKLEPGQSGDEPYLMANLLPQIPVVIGADRYASGCLAIDRFNPDVILLDDAFQHIQLHRDLNLLLLDAVSPTGNGYMLPRGTLREPLDAASRADAIIFTRSVPQQEQHQSRLPFESCNRPVFYCRHTPAIRCLVPAGSECKSMAFQSREHHGDKRWVSSPLFVFSGLARNASFKESVAKMGGEIVGGLGFDDHHKYTDAELKEINQKAIEVRSSYLVTTDKDYVRLPKQWCFSLDLIVIGVEIDFGGDGDRWRNFLQDRLDF